MCESGARIHKSAFRETGGEGCLLPGGRNETAVREEKRNTQTDEWRSDNEGNTWFQARLNLIVGVERNPSLPFPCTRRRHTSAGRATSLFACQAFRGTGAA